MCYEASRARGTSWDFAGHRRAPGLPEPLPNAGRVGRRCNSDATCEASLPRGGALLMPGMQHCRRRAACSLGRVHVKDYPAQPAEARETAELQGCAGSAPLSCGVKVVTHACALAVACMQF